jgi:hypothetical protein
MVIEAMTRRFNPMVSRESGALRREQFFEPKKTLPLTAFAMKIST